ncbi:hypothetical protein EVAR_88551_1 [Eumeta japonica]|uniref:Uncharacterized protein n=1 Tax=Eumeta variegata TaxID=151549 RepID=A0A4C1WK69_EUMVA|nr:hypothetical protein EVAR_88551_1 [Eumeta japonica]
MEIVLEAVVVQALGPSSGPEILIFKRFRSAWPSIDQRKFSIVSSDPDALRYVQNIADSTISFAKKQLNDYQPRDDYKELLTLTIIFLGGVPNKGISFRAPADFYNPGNSVYISTKEPRLWEEDEDYKASREIVRSMRVVNDIAERGVALIEEFNKIITSDEEQKQFLLWL